jgi:protoporphyrinogen oxidase
MQALTRRDLLAAFLGAPVGCALGSRPRPRLPPGQIVGATFDLGHRVRAHAIPTPSDWTDAPVVVVGAGVAGLAAAWRLRRAGVDAKVLELEAAPGGTARAGASPVTAYPWGAHYITAPLAENRPLVELLGEMGLLDGTDDHGEPVIAEEHLCRDPQERLFYRGRWYEGLYLHAGASAEDERQLAAFEAEVGRWAAWRDGRGRRAFTIPVSRCSDDPEVIGLDRQSAAEWLDRRGLSSPRLRWLVDYACRDDYGTRLEGTSAWAAMFYFAARLPRPGAESRPIVTWPEGNGALVAHLAARAQVQSGTVVVDVAPRADGVDVIALADRGARAVGVRAEQVIFAAPQLVARHVVRPFRDAPPAHVGEFEYSAWMVANLAVPEVPRGAGFPPAWDNVLHDSPALGYVVATHQRGTRGPTVLTYYLPLTDADTRSARARLAAAGQPEWADVTLSDLGRAHPDLPARVERLDVMRWGHAMIRPRPGFVWGGARAAAARPFRGIHFAHSDLSGVALFEEAFDQGLRAADEVLAARR